MSKPQSDGIEWVEVSTLTRMESAYLRPSEIRAGRIPRDVLRARMESASGSELARMREAGEQIAIRGDGTDKGRRILTTSVVAHEESRVR